MWNCFLPIFYAFVWNTQISGGAIRFSFVGIPILLRAPRRGTSANRAEGNPTLSTFPPHSPIILIASAQKKPTAHKTKADHPPPLVSPAEVFLTSPHLTRANTFIPPSPSLSLSLSLSLSIPGMAAMNSSVLSCNYAVSGTTSDASWKLASPPSVATATAGPSPRLPAIRAQQARPSGPKEVRVSDGRRTALLCLGAALFTAAASSASQADAGIIDEYLEKTKANKELNDKKRLATSGANFSRAYTVEFGTCKFPENFTGCQDLAKQKKVPFLSDDLDLECEGKDRYKCGSNIFWKW